MDEIKNIKWMLPVLEHKEIAEETEVGTDIPLTFVRTAQIGKTDIIHLETGHSQIAEAVVGRIAVECCIRTGGMTSQTKARTQ